MLILKDKELEVIKNLRIKTQIPLHITLSGYNEVKLVNDLLKGYRKKKHMFLDALRTMHRLKRIHSMYPDGRNWNEFREWFLLTLENHMKKKIQR